MEIDVAALKQMIIRRNTTLDAVAKKLDIDRSTLYRKLRGDARGLTLREAQEISLYLDLTLEDILRIFWKSHGADLHKRAAGM